MGGDGHPYGWDRHGSRADERGACLIERSSSPSSHGAPGTGSRLRASPGRVAQWESARFTRERSLVRNQPRPFTVACFRFSSEAVASRLLPQPGGGCEGGGAVAIDLEPNQHAVADREFVSVSELDGNATSLPGGIHRDEDQDVLLIDVEKALGLEPQLLPGPLRAKTP